MVLPVSPTPEEVPVVPPNIDNPPKPPVEEPPHNDPEEDKPVEEPERAPPEVPPRNDPQPEPVDDPSPPQPPLEDPGRTPPIKEPRWVGWPMGFEPTTTGITIQCISRASMRFFSVRWEFFRQIPLRFYAVLRGIVPTGLVDAPASLT